MVIISTEGQAHFFIIIFSTNRKHNIFPIFHMRNNILCYILMDTSIFSYLFLKSY